MKQKNDEALVSGFNDCTNEFLDALSVHSAFEKWRSASINMVYGRNKSRKTIQLSFDSKLFQDLEIVPKDFQTPNPESFLRISRSTTEAAASVNIKETPVKKVLLEVDVLTGHAILKME